jgi:hypothetical protein
MLDYFLFAIVFRPTLGPTQFLIQWLWGGGALSAGGKFGGA